ncbi:MAG: hypothetical protein V3V41_07880 [Candidatus Heimdallarchaeota archaeon]
MVDNTQRLFIDLATEIDVIIGGSQHLRDHHFGEAIVEGVISAGDALSRGTAATQAIARVGTESDFLGFALGHSIRQSDTETPATVLTVGKTLKYLKPTAKGVQLQSMFGGFTTGETVVKGDPVFYNNVGLTIGAGVAIGDIFAGAGLTDDWSKIGHLLEDVVIPDATTNSENVPGQWEIS